jgi:hypothetical protein
MREQQSSLGSKPIATLVKMLLAFFIIVFFLLPPVKQWLNAEPVRLRVIYALMTLFCLYGLIQAYRERSSTFALVRWAVILLAVGSSVLAVFGVGQIFFTISKVCAIAFIVMEIGHILYEGLAGGTEMREGNDG